MFHRYVWRFEVAIILSFTPFNNLFDLKLIYTVSSKMYLANRCYTLTYIDVIYLIFALRGKICDNTFQIYYFY